MGELLYCNEPIAAMPYYIEGISWTIYSLEDLCFYIENNPYLIDKDLMCEELCTWIGKELKYTKLSEHLQDILRMEGRLSDYVYEILNTCGYTPKQKITSILMVLREMEEKSDFERNKLRADRLMEKERYLGSIFEYKRLLESSDSQNQDGVILGNIWHNLGTAYARLFLFKEAASCYEKAYGLNRNGESLKECIFAYRCLHDELGIMKISEKYNINEDEIQEIREELAQARHGEEITSIEDRIDRLADVNSEDLKQILFNWKEEYRRISRI